MLSRLFSATFGAGVGMVVGAAAVRRFDLVAQAVAPGNVGATLGRQAVRLAEGMKTGVLEAREVARLSLEEQRRSDLTAALAQHAANVIGPRRATIAPPHVITVEAEVLAPEREAATRRA